MVQDRAILKLPTILLKSWSIEQRHCQWPWTTPNSGFKVTPLVNAEYLINGTWHIIIHRWHALPRLSSMYVGLVHIPTQNGGRCCAPFDCAKPSPSRSTGGFHGSVCSVNAESFWICVWLFCLSPKCNLSENFYQVWPWCWWGGRHNHRHTRSCLFAAKNWSVYSCCLLTLC